jgi:hypothetical protein
MKIALMSRLTSLRAVPARAEKRPPAGFRLPPLRPSQGAKWQPEEEMLPPHGGEPPRQPLAWPRAALLIGLLSLALWGVIAALVIHFTR